MTIILNKTIKSSKRLGRGRSSGKGKTSSRGMSGQKSRTGASTKTFEGGQTKLIQRLPKKKGFKHWKKKRSMILNSEEISAMFKDAKNVSKDLVIKKIAERSRIISNDTEIKIVRKGREPFDLEITDIKLSKSIRSKQPHKNE